MQKPPRGKTGEFLALRVGTLSSQGSFAGEFSTRREKMTKIMATLFVSWVTWFPYDTFYFLLSVVALSLRICKMPCICFKWLGGLVSSYGEDWWTSVKSPVKIDKHDFSLIRKDELYGDTQSLYTLSLFLLVWYTVFPFTWWKRENICTEIYLWLQATEPLNHCSVCLRTLFSSALGMRGQIAISPFQAGRNSDVCLLWVCETDELAFGQIRL